MNKSLQDLGGNTLAAAIAGCCQPVPGRLETSDGQWWPRIPSGKRLRMFPQLWKSIGNWWFNIMFNGDLMGFYGILASGNLTQLLNITMFNGKTHYFDWAMFNSYVKLQKGSKGYMEINPPITNHPSPLWLFHRWFHPKLWFSIMLLLVSNFLKWAPRINGFSSPPSLLKGTHHSGGMDCDNDIFHLPLIFVSHLYLQVTLLADSRPSWVAMMWDVALTLVPWPVFLPFL